MGKAFGIATGILGFVTTLSSLSTYADGCYSNLPSPFPFPSQAGGFTNIDVDWKLGPGFILLLLATLMKPFDALIHCIMPSPVTKTKEGYHNANDWDAKLDDHYLGDGTAS